MKITKQQLRNLIKEQFESLENDLDREVEAEVVGDSSPNSYRNSKTIVFTVSRSEPLSINAIEQQAIEGYYEEGGYGDDPQVISLKVDGKEVGSEDLGSLMESIKKFNKMLNKLSK